MNSMIVGKILCWQKVVWEILIVFCVKHDDWGWWVKSWHEALVDDVKHKKRITSDTIIM